MVQWTVRSKGSCDRGLYLCVMGLQVSAYRALATLKLEVESADGEVPTGVRGAVRSKRPYDRGLCLCVMKLQVNVYRALVTFKRGGVCRGGQVMDRIGQVGYGMGWWTWNVTSLAMCWVNRNWMGAWLGCVTMDH